MKELFSYIRFRQYLHDWYAECKKKHTYFSHRYLAQKLEIGSSGYLLAVMQGKRNLTEAVAEKLMAFMTLSKKERDYFQLLVSYDQAKTEEEKQFLFEKILKQRKKELIAVPQEKYQFYEQWYYLVLREAVALYEISDDVTVLTKVITPHVKADAIREGLELLESIGFIYRNEKGIYRRSDPVITTGGEWASATIENLQATFCDLAKEALHCFPKEERDMTNLTLSISSDTLPRIKKRVQEMRHELLQMAQGDAHPDTVVQCNFQIFPLLQKEEESHG